MLETWQIGLLALVLGNVIIALSQRGLARQRGGYLAFEVGRPFKLIFYGEGILLVWGLLELLLRPAREIWIVLFLLGMGFLFWKTVPTILYIGPDGLRESRLFARSEKIIKWNEVATVTFRPAFKTTTVYSLDGLAIAHSQVHQDSERFRREVLSRSSVKDIQIEEEGRPTRIEM